MRDPRSLPDVLTKWLDEGLSRDGISHEPETPKETPKETLTEVPAEVPAKVPDSKISEKPAKRTKKEEPKETKTNSLVEEELLPLVCHDIQQRMKHLDK